MDYLKNLTRNINARFKDLIAESFDFVQFSFKTDIGTTNCGAITLEMAGLQADNEAGVNFDVFQDIAKLWIQLPSKHSTVRKRALQVRVRLGSTYVCEAATTRVQFRRWSTNPDIFSR